MRKFFLAFVAVSLVVPPALMIDSAPAAAKHRHKTAYREWRGRDGRVYCRKPDGTTGLVLGGIGGALIGRSIDTRGDRTAGTVLGALGGALAGRAIERGGEPRCR